ncbi:uncharacterized protein LOC112349699 [Selaginella moellendorffii]|uniref:uncharacterized protein LOC112349699 n=1 Tax=Selaginella moellendorffii TaxID=88036 RepID=UPI000D1C8E37|nr:uncharacterized protein LOC112349699 [Selaginella moellendorffii]|eukprot:XP_024540371.1 uncharacterized protein LOC112349699 [Selaginella moellendorffii]
MKRGMESEPPRYCWRFVCDDPARQAPPVVRQEQSSLDTPQSVADNSKSFPMEAPEAAFPREIPHRDESSYREERFLPMRDDQGSMLMVGRFGGARFHVWKMRMQMLLVLHDQWGVVSGSEARPGESARKEDCLEFEKKDARARANILLHLEDRQLMQVWHTTSAKQAWDLLGDMYMAF